MTAKREKLPRIGFPPPLLGWNPQRLPVIGRGDGYLVLNKPGDVVPRAHRWYPKAPDLEAALQHQMNERKPELERMGLTADKTVRAAFSYPPGISGAALLAVSGEGGPDLLNDYGSSLVELTFHFLARDNATEDAMDMDLPIAEHSAKPQALISHKTGKKTLTQFRRLERMGPYGWWEARTTFYRMDQLRVHAREVGLNVIGDREYTREPDIFLSKLKRNWSGDPETERPLYEGLCVHLQQASWRPGGSDEALVFTADLPPRLNTLLKKLREFL